MTKALTFFSIITIFIISGCSSSITISNAKYESASYNMFGNVNERIFYIPKSIGDTIKLKWTAEIHGSFANNSISAFQDYVFAPDLSGRIYAFDIETGKELGQIKYKGSIFTTPLIDHLYIIFPVAEFKEPKSTVYIYNFQTGKESAQIEVEGNIKTELLKTGSEIIFVTEQGKAFKYNINTEKVWEFDTKAYMHSTPALVENSLIFGNDKGEIISLNAQTGVLNYRKKISSGFESGFSIKNDTIYCADNSGVIYALELNSGNVIWKFNSGYKITTTPASDNSYLYIGNLRGEIYKLNKQNGNTLWKIQTGGVIDITPLVFNDYIVQPDLNKKLYFIEKNKGYVTRTMQFENRAKLSPVFYKEKLFLGIDNGKLLAYDLLNNQAGSRK